MDMTVEQYERLIRRLEALAERNPRGYRLRLAGLAALGYGYILLILAVFVAILAGLASLLVVTPILAIKLGLFVLIPAWAVASALWVKLEPPDGRRLSRAEAPRLFAELDQIRQTLQAPRVDEVLVTQDFNAAVVQIPRLGLLGWQKHYLILGLPLMMSLSPEEWRAVVAHELGHLSGNHSKFATWIYRVRRTWANLQTSFEQGRNSSWLFNWFLKRFAPYFGAYSFVLARSNEYEADRAAAELAGAQAAGQALCKVEVTGEYLAEHFWPEIQRRNDRSPAPPTTLFTEMKRSIETSVDTADAEVLLRRALSRHTDLTDTHPSLTDRLEALGVEPVLPDAPATTAAQAFLGPAAESLLRSFDDEFAQSVQMQWRHLYEQAQQGKQRLEALERRGDDDALSIDERFERAALIERFEPDADHLANYQAVLADDPQHGWAHLAVARLLLADDDEAGLTHAETAMAEQLHATGDACALIIGYLFKHDRRAEAQRYIDRYDVHQQKMAAAYQERNEILPADLFLPHDLPAEALAQLVSQLETYLGVEAAWLVSKRVEHFPDEPQLILCVDAGGGFTGSGNRDVVERIAAEVEFPSPTLIFDVGNSQNRWLKKKARKVGGARIV